MLCLNRFDKKNKNSIRLSVSQQIRLNIIEEPPSGPSHERVISAFREFFRSSVFEKDDSFLKIISIGRLALPTLYSIIVDEKRAMEISEKIFKKDPVQNTNPDPNQKEKEIQKRLSLVRSGACILISKIVIKLDAEEKSKAADVFYYVLANKNYDEDTKLNVLYGIRSIGDSAHILVPLVNEIILDKAFSVKIRIQAIAMMGGMQNIGKRSADSLLKVISDETENIIVKRNAITAFGDLSDYMNDDKIKEGFKTFLSELEKVEDENFKDTVIDSLGNFGERCVDDIFEVISDRNRKIDTRIRMLRSIFKVGKVNFMLHDYVLDSLVKLKEKYRSSAYGKDGSLNCEIDLKISNEIDYIIRNLVGY